MLDGCRALLSMATVTSPTMFNQLLKSIRLFFCSCLILGYVKMCGALNCWIATRLLLSICSAWNKLTYSTCQAIWYLYPVIYLGVWSHKSPHDKGLWWGNMELGCARYLTRYLDCSAHGIHCQCFIVCMQLYHLRLETSKEIAQDPFFSELLISTQ